MAISRQMKDETLILENTESGESIEILETVNEDHVRITPKGELTGNIAHDLEDELTAIGIACHNIVFDMGEVTMIDKPIIRMMLDVQHMIDGFEGEFIITGIRSGVMEQFEEMGLDAVFDIQEIEDVKATVQ